MGAIPSIWAIGQQGAFEVSANDVGALGGKALAIIPSASLPRFGMYGGGPTEGWGLLFPNELYHYPLPDLPIEPDTALAKDFFERLLLWENKAQNVNVPSITMGQTTNHQVFDAAVVDPSVPLIDLRLQRGEDGAVWVLLQHEAGVWLSIRADFDVAPYDFETGDELYLLSCGVNRDGSAVALFGYGVLNMDTYRTFDYQMQLYFGMGKIWHNNAIWKWPARIIPVVLAQNAEELQKLFALIKKEEE
jgi:hypothetical protein